MVANDNFVSELEDDIQREQWINFWRRYGLSIIGVVLLMLVLLGGYFLWSSSREKALLRLSDRYEEGLQNFKDGNSETALVIFQELAKDTGASYGLLAQAYVAGLCAMQADQSSSEEKERAASKAYEVLQNPTIREAGLRGVVDLSKAYFLINLGKSSPLFAQLATYQAPQNPWAGLAFEVQALEAMARKKKNIAQALYTKAMKDVSVSGGIKSRLSLQMMGAGLSFPDLSRSMKAHP